MAIRITRRGHFTWVMAGVAALSLTVTSCGGAPGSGGDEANAVGPDDGEDASGSVTLCGQTDAGGAFEGMVEEFNEENPDFDAEYVSLGGDTDQARTQMVQRMEAESEQCDLFNMDVTWVTEFAAQGWLMDQTELIDSMSEAFIDATLETALYDDKYWGTPYYTDAALIYYLPEKVDAPDTWQDLYDQAGEGSEAQYLYQGQEYEGLTVNFLELLNGAGGSVIDDDGEVTIDSDEAREVVEFMADGVDEGAVPRSILTYVEDDSQRAFVSGDYGSMRNWPSYYQLLQEDDSFEDFDVAPLPSWEGNDDGAGILGGRNLAISAFSDNPDAAVALLQFASSPEWQKQSAVDYTRASVLDETYDDPEVQEALPFSEELRESVNNAVSRPASPVYPQISRAIYDNVYAAIAGDIDADTAVTQMAEQIESAQDTF